MLVCGKRKSVLCVWYRFERHSELSCGMKWSGVQCSAVEWGEGSCQLEGGDWGASRALHSQRCEIFPMTILFVFRALCARLAPHLDPTQPTPLHPTYPTLLDRPALSRRPLACLRRHPNLPVAGSHSICSSFSSGMAHNVGQVCSICFIYAHRRWRLSLLFPRQKAPSLLNGNSCQAIPITASSIAAPMYPPSRPYGGISWWIFQQAARHGLALQASRGILTSFERLAKITKHFEGNYARILGARIRMLGALNFETKRNISKTLYTN